MQELCLLQALSPVGRCKTFEVTADGYGRGEGFVTAMLQLVDTSSSMLGVIRVSSWHQLALARARSLQLLYGRQYSAHRRQPATGTWPEAHHMIQFSTDPLAGIPLQHHAMPCRQALLREVQSYCTAILTTSRSKQTGSHGYGGR